jgi:hypothetical protein
VNIYNPRINKAQNNTVISQCKNHRSTIYIYIYIYIYNSFNTRSSCSSSSQTLYKSNFVAYNGVVNKTGGRSKLTLTFHEGMSIRTVKNTSYIIKIKKKATDTNQTFWYLQVPDVDITSNVTFLCISTTCNLICARTARHDDETKYAS